MTAPTPAPGKAAQPRHHDIPALKERLRIPEVWQKLHLEGQPAEVCRSPFREDKSPSFSIYKEGRRWKDHATGASGDVIDFIAMARQLSKGEAFKLFLEMAGVPLPAGGRAPGSGRQGGGGVFKIKTAGLLAPREKAAGSPLRVPIQRCGPQEWEKVARTRQISMDAVSLALGLRTLTFGMVQGFRCWLLVDDAGRIAEARRVEGRPFPSCGPLAARKAHTLRGSQKSWPLGVAVLRRLPDFRTLLLVEGGPDYLAALHFAAELDRWDVLPVAMLGRGAGAKIDPEALELMRGRRVRIYPHDDADGGGLAGARLWAAQLHLQGCITDIFEFSGLRRADGTPVKDLNDCTTGLDEASAEKLRRTLIPPPMPAQA